MPLSVIVDAVTDGVTLNAPTIGLGLGWLVSLWFVAGLIAGKLHSDKAWLARERDHRLEGSRQQRDHERQTEWLEHQLTEWRAESRIKDAQIVELNEQAAERNRQIRALESLGGTVEELVLGIRDLAGRDMAGRRTGETP